TGRYGTDCPEILEKAAPDELGPIESTPYLWSELRWAARAEGVVHLDDLLLRRVRLGLLLPEGGQELLPKIRKIAQPELQWSDQTWQEEESRYLAIWDAAYKVR
ncbi:MAG: glycerol-3-phosphate dehydrogenase C-terminal domain-containing protein, partial [Anaerolineales bacterium]